MKNKSCVLYCDGASRGNPGSGGAGAVLMDDGGEILATVKKYLGSCTNNVAEYMALIYGLDEAIEKSCRHLEIYMDSELLVRQINNVYRVKNANLINLMKDVRKRLAQLEGYTVSHVPRERNKIADRLANEAIDEAV